MDEAKILERLDALEAENQKLKLEVERAQAVNDIQRLIGNYYNNHIMGESDEYVTMQTSYVYFADRPDTTYEVADYGLFVGYDNVKAFLTPTHGNGGKPGPGGPGGPGMGAKTIEENGGKPLRTAMMEHWLCTPMIVVAGDGKTARGVWHAPGSETAGEMCQWALGRVAADFIKEDDGQWKIWHYHYYRIFRTDFDTPWTEMDQRYISRQKDKEEYRAVGGDPDRILPTTYFKPYGYGPNIEPIPATPKPYDTFTEDMLPI